jgi:hypothetical protein
VKSGAALALMLVAPAAAAAQEAWSFRLTPHFWAPALDTEVVVRGGVPADLDLDGVMAALSAAVTAHESEGLRVEALGAPGGLGVGS